MEHFCLIFFVLFKEFGSLDLLLFELMLNFDVNGDGLFSNIERNLLNDFSAKF